MTPDPFDRIPSDDSYTGTDLETELERTSRMGADKEDGQ